MFAAHLVETLAIGSTSAHPLHSDSVVADQILYWRNNIGRYASQNATPIILPGAGRDNYCKTTRRTRLQSRRAKIRPWSPVATAPHRFYFRFGIRPVPPHWRHRTAPISNCRSPEIGSSGSRRTAPDWPGSAPFPRQGEHVSSIQSAFVSLCIVPPLILRSADTLYLVWRDWRCNPLP